MDIKSLLILNSFCLLILYFNPLVEGNTPFGFCANPECTVPVSKGITTLRYMSPDDSKISVEVNEEVLIYVKEYGAKKDLWGIVAQGNKGYISKNFIRETQLFMKRLVPANVEFKTNILVSESFVVSGQFHVSSQQQLQSGMLMNDIVPESSIHSQTVQQDFNSIQTNSFQQNQGSPLQNSEASHLFSNMDPSDNIQYNPHLSQSQHFGQSHQLNDVPMHSSQFPSGHISSLPHMSGVESGNILPSPTPVPNVNFPSQYQSVSDDPLLHSQSFGNSLNGMPNFEQQQNFLNQGGHIPNSIFPNGHEHPSMQQQHPSGHIAPNFVFPSGYEHPSMQQQLPSGHIAPNSVFPSGHEDPNIQQQHSSGHEHPSMQQQHPNKHIVPNSVFPNGHEHPNVQQQQPSGHIVPNSDFLSGHEHPSVQQQQHFDSSHASEMHPSLYSQNVDDDIARTLALLSDRGFANTDVFGNPIIGSDVQPSSQDLNRGSGLNEAESSGIPSQLQNQPVYSSDSSSFPPVNPSQPVEEANVINSHSPEAFVVDNNKPPGNVVVENVKSTTEEMKEDENEEEDEELDVVAEGEDEIPDEDEEEEDEGTPETDNPTLISKQTGGIELQLQSSMSTSQSEQQTSNMYQDIQSSENSVRDSNLVLESSIDKHTKSSILNSDENNMGETTDSILNSISDSVIDIKSDSVSSDSFGDVSESFSERIPDFPERNNNGALPTDNIIYDKEHTTPKINDFFSESEQSSDLDKLAGTVDIEGMSEDLTTYQIRNLKGEFGNSDEQQSDSDGISDENNTQSDSETHSSFQNWLDSFRAFVDAIMSWIPEPLYSALMDLQNKDLSPRVPVFTALCGFICIFLIVPIICVKEWSKESRLTAQLASVEKDAYTLSATNSVLEEKLESVQSELAALQASLAEEKSTANNFKMVSEDQEEELENAKAEIESCLQVIESLKEKENEYLTTIQDKEKKIEQFAEHKEALVKIMKDQENSVSDLTDQLQESESKLEELEKEKLQFLQLKEDYEEKLSQFDKNCSQLLQEAEVWNLRVQELSTNLEEERKLKEEFIESLKIKDGETEALKELVESFKLFDEIEDPEEQAKAKEEKLQSLMDSSMILNQLKQEEEKSKLLDEQLTKEKNKILDMEVELLDAKSEIDKLKMSYNQALQDKAEAQTKLDVLTNYFKDKEIQLQKQLGAQEAVRQKKEEDANSAERRICLIEQENASYKYQVASMKQEMEETERNLKSQIAAQEKKAHENWIAARAAERKLEDMKQEVTQLRQRLTLLEREQESWANTPRDEVIRPVPKRMPGVNDESGNQDLNASERGMFPPPPLHDRLPPHMMLPPDRPLPPLHPPPMPPMFLPHMERHFRPQPWHIPPEHSSDYRTTPPEFMAGRELTPPRGRQAMDGDAGPHASSPLTTDTRDSRNSTPPHLLPDFHDVPPQPGRPFFPPPPPLGHPRLPMHPPFRRDAGPGPKRLDHPNEFNSRGSQQAPPQEQWQHSRV